MRLHVAAGARQIAALAAGMPEWRVGDDVDRYVERLKRVPLRAGGFRLFAAHQMGTCRMGADPQTSVANPYGELHDTPGVWIGDASAFPTSSGHQPDDHDHGARPPHGRGDRGDDARATGSRNRIRRHDGHATDA